MSETEQNTIRDAVLALQNGESGAFKDAIAASLMDKAMDAINVQRIGAAQSLFAEPEISPEENTEPEEVADEEV